VYWLRCGIRGSIPGRRKRYFTFPKRPDRLWRLTSILFSGYRGVFYMVQRPGRNVEHSPASSIEVKYEWSCTSSPPTCFHGVDRDNVTLTISPVIILFLFSKYNLCSLRTRLNKVKTSLWIKESCITFVHCYISIQKQVKIQCLQDPNQSNVDNLSSVRREAVRHFRKKRGKNRKLILINLEHTVRTRISEMCVGAFETLRRVISLELII
jgi:hypothetical protein